MGKAKVEEGLNLVFDGLVTLYSNSQRTGKKEK